MKRYKKLFEETHPYYIEKYIDKRANSIFERQKEIVGRGEELPWISFKPLLEAVIRPDKYVSLLIEELRFFLQEHNNRIVKYSFVVIDLLNKLFKKYNFFFVEDQRITNNYVSGINDAGTTPSNFKTTFFCNMKIIDLFTNIELQNGFVEHFKELLGHELIHRGQFLNKQDEEIRKEVFKVKKVYDVSKQNDRRSYYSRKQEIMAYAWMIIEELHFNGLSNEQIALMIKRDSDIKNLSPILDEYKRLFDNNSGVLKRLYKYIMDYLTGSIKDTPDLTII